MFFPSLFKILGNKIMKAFFAFICCWSNNVYILILAQAQLIICSRAVWNSAYKLNASGMTMMWHMTLHLYTDSDPQNMYLCLEADSQRAEDRSCDTVCKGKTPASKYLHVAILVPVGEDVPIDVSKRRNPGQNWRVCCYISRLQVPRGINVWGLKRRPERITVYRNMLSMMWSTIRLTDSDGMA